MAESLAAVMAVNRFGLGARPGELARAKTDPRGWLKEQIAGERSLPADIARLPSSNEIFQKYLDTNVARREARRASAASEPPVANSAQVIAQNIRQVIAPLYLEQVAARYRVAVKSEEPFRERLVHFWTNHFAVSADKVQVMALAGALENEAIRPNIGRRFIDMLWAVERHPAMLIYLDNQLSAGPNSPLAKRMARRPQRVRRIGINENLAREILELHTLGVNGGYTQADVTAFAQALTGWSVGGQGPGLRGDAQGEPGRFLFREGMHEPGAKTILGKTYADSGEAQAKAVLEDLSRHPSTAQFIATKLVRHFVADEPPTAAIERVAKAFRDSDGDLPTVHRAVIDLEMAWKIPLTKFKTPHEFIVSTWRLLDFVPREPNQIAAPFELLGQRPYTPGSPAGWPDIASHWDGADALMKRIEWASSLAARLDSRSDPLQVAERSLAGVLGDHTRTAITRAASAAQALTLLLVSPEFQRR